MKLDRLIIPVLALTVMIPTLGAQGKGRGPAGVPGGGMRSPSAPPSGGGAPQSHKPSEAAPGKEMRSPEMRTEMKASHDIARNERLSTKLQPLFPPGTDMTVASQGFKNTGQFVAAAHVSKNLEIPFDEIKSRVASGDSLGDAVRALKPNMDKGEVKRQVKEAERQAKKDLKEAPPPPAS